tara:strand:- start:525 stop:1361 length:837 start_codon:yes stop_codon:yes gene_type:complete
MPSKSKQQQKFFGIVRSIQKGDAPASKFSKQAKKAAKDMEKDDVKSYASTKHKGLPKKVNRESLESLENGIRNMVKEFMTESHHDKREGKMAKYDAKEIAQDAADVFKMIDKDMDLPEWLEAKITIAAHNMNSVKDYLTHHQPKNEGKLKEAGSLGGPISYGSDIASSYIAPKRDTSGGMKTFHQKFSSPEARSIIDGQLKMMAKELRKVQNKVIKTWMQGAKSGTIDFFDIIRGLKTGDARRAHPYETEFLVNVLTKDKIIDRFRSYFKGKKGKKRN